MISPTECSRLGAKFTTPIYTRWIWGPPQIIAVQEVASLTSTMAIKIPLDPSMHNYEMKRIPTLFFFFVCFYRGCHPMTISTLCAEDAIDSVSGLIDVKIHSYLVSLQSVFSSI